jgi:hypothetical protein
LWLVSQEGIEPSTRGLKVPCSTTELLARCDAEFTKSPGTIPSENCRRPRNARASRKRLGMIGPDEFILLPAHTLHENEMWVKLG